MKYSWADVHQLEDAIASGRFNAEVSAALAGMDRYSAPARRDAALAELLGTSLGALSVPAGGLALASYAGKFLDAGGAVYNVKHPSFGAVGDGVVDDLVAFRAAIDAAALAGKGGEVVVPPGDYILSGNPFKNQMGVLGPAGRSVSLRLFGASLKPSKQIALPTNTIIFGNGRLASRIHAEASFISKVNITSVDRTSNVVTVVTATAHGAEVGASVVLEAVTDTSFNGGWQVASVPTATSLTFAQTAANTTSSGGTVTIPITAGGDTAPASSGSRIENVSINCRALVGGVGYYSNLINEQSGLRHVAILDSYRFGFWIERHGSTVALTGPQNYILDDVEVHSTPNVGATGGRIYGTFAAHRGLNDLTTTCYGGSGTSAVGLDISGVQGVISRVHNELCTDGILIGGRATGGSATNGACLVIQGVTSHSSVTNVVRLTGNGETHDVVVMAVAKCSATNVLNDARTGLVLTNDWLAMYATGQGSSGQFAQFSTAPGHNWIVDGDVSIGTNTGAAAKALKLNSAAGQSRSVQWLTAGLKRWIADCTSEAEAGSDAGSNLQLISYDDAGAQKTVLVKFNRATGVGTLLGELITAASTTTRAGLNLPHGSAPTSPVNGDIWTTTAGLFVRINGVTVGPLT